MSLLENRVGFVTGASRGIGRASAQALAAEGVRVAIGYREDKDGAAGASALCPGSIVVRIDVTVPESVAAAFDEIQQTLGPVEVLVNNAGLRRDGLLIRMKEQDWDEVIAANLTGAFRCTKRALPSMLQRRWGRIVSIGSVAGSVGNAGQANYAAAKAGLIGFTKTVAREMASRNITCNAVAPGFVPTDLTNALLKQMEETILKQIPLGRFGTVEDVANTIAFLVSDDASYITGQVVQIDGGMVT